MRLVLFLFVPLSRHRPATANMKFPLGSQKFLHERSYVNVQGLQAIQHHELKRMIGRLSDADLQAVMRAIKWLFDIDTEAQG